jgi:ATP-dependent Clp protease ATP-binding subunit ClpA
VLTLAQEEAERSRHTYIGTEHILLGLLRESDGIAHQTLNNLGVEIAQVRKTLETVLGRSERILIQQIIPTSRVKKVIELSFEEARRMGNGQVGTHHLLLGLIVERDGIAAHVLQDLRATEGAVRAEIERLLAAGTEEESGPASGPASGPLTYQVGDRVLVHDPVAPYRLWEGRVTGVVETGYEVSIRGHPRDELVSAGPELVHPVPMRWTRDCPFCGAI